MPGSLAVLEVKVTAMRRRLQQARRTNNPKIIREAEEELAWAQKELDDARNDR